MSQMSVVNMMNAMVPITRFNKGEAAKIFDEVETTGTKIVVKNNRPASGKNVESVSARTGT